MSDEQQPQEPFNAPPEVVVQILSQKAESDETLARYLEAAFWQAAAQVERQIRYNSQTEETEDVPDLKSI